MLAHRVAQTYPPKGYSPTSNMLTRNTLPFPPGFSFSTTKFSRATPLYPPGLHIDPDVVRRQVTPRFTPESTLMPNMVQHFSPQYPPELPLKSKIVQQVEQVAPKHSPGPFSNGWTKVSYSGMPPPGSPGIPQPEVSSTPYEEETQRQMASIVQFFIDDAQSQPSSQASYIDNSSNGHQHGDEHKLTEANMQLFKLQTNMTPRGSPPDCNPWGVPNTDLDQRVPFDHPRLDQDYEEEKYPDEIPECFRIITPEEALAIGTWTGQDRDFNHGIESWMVHQEADGITNSHEEVWENAGEEGIFSRYTYDPPFFFEDIENPVQPWDSGSWTAERANDYQKEHEVFKQWLVSRGKEYLEDERDWLISNKPDPEIARVLEEGW